MRDGYYIMAQAALLFFDISEMGSIERLQEIKERV